MGIGRHRGAGLARSSQKAIRPGPGLIHQPTLDIGGGRRGAVGIGGDLEDQTHHRATQKVCVGVLTLAGQLGSQRGLDLLP